MSDYQITAWLTALAAGPCYLTLFTSDPFVPVNPLTVELTGAGFARIVPTWSLSGKILTATNSLLWTSIQPGSAITHIGAFDAAFNGNFLFAGPIPNQPVSYPNGGYLQLAANTYHVGIDA
jgi:hypothetical protein